MEVIFNIIRDDLHIWLALSLGTLWLAKKIERRKCFYLRGIFCAILMISCSVILRVVMYQGNKPVYYNVKYIVLYLLAILCVYMSYKCHIMTAVFYATAAYCLQNAVTQIWALIDDTNFLPSLGNYLLLIVNVVILFGLFGKFLNMTSTAESYMERNAKGKNLVLLVAILIVLTNVILQVMAYDDVGGAVILFYTGQYYTRLYIHITSGMISCLALTLTLSDIRKSDSEKKMEIALSLLEKDKNEYEYEKTIVNEINIKCHDLRHQIAFLGEKGYQTEMEGINELINLYDIPNQTGNRALDIVLGEKSRICLGKHISMTCMSDGSLISFMEESDIYSLFGNILDNAIQAADKIKAPENRIINLRVRKQNAFVMIEEENYYEGEIEIENGLPKTQTGDFFNHGFGTQSMRILAEKYGGNLSISTKYGVFRVSILMRGIE